MTGLILNNKRNFTIAYVDYSRAFDILSHLKLLLKLSNWQSSHPDKMLLSNKTYCPRVGSAVSRPLSLSNGVFQGSCVGPLVFTIYINDVYQIFDADTTCKLYDDDIKWYSDIVTDEQSHMTSGKPRSPRWSVH